MKPSGVLALASAATFSAGAGAIECNAEQFIVNSQQDADALSACTAPLIALNGSLTIGPDATGAIEFKNVNLVLNGSITAQDNSGLTSLTFTTARELLGLVNVRLGDVTLRNLTGLTSISAPYIFDTYGLLLQDLPSLETVNFPSLDLVWMNFGLVGLPRLRTFRHSGEGRAPFIIAGNTTIKDVALDNIDKFATTDDRGSISIQGIPNVTLLTYYNPSKADVTIAGNGNLTLIFDCTNCSQHTNPLREIKGRSLTVSGLAAMGRNTSQGAEFNTLEVGSFTAVRNSFTMLPLEFSNLSTLHIVDNPKLSTLSYDQRFGDYTWKEIVITGNPKLRLNSSYSSTGADTKSWVWQSGNISTMVFEGPFDNAFFEPLIEQTKQLQLREKTKGQPRVLSKFVVNSSLGPEFNCTGLNGLRKAGYLKGEYSCQNQTVADESGGMKPNPITTISLLPLTFVLVIYVPLVLGF